MNKRVRLLILRGGAIGDFILTVPAIAALRERWPDAYIELIGYPHIANLALAAGLVDHVDSLDRAEMARFFSLRPDFTPRQSEYIRSFDLVVTYLHDPDGSVRTNFELAGAKQVIYGSPIVGEGHAVDHFMKPLEELAIYGEKPVPRLVLGEPRLREGREKLAALGLSASAVAIHPGSGSAKKNWPVERFVEVARGVQPLFTVGEADAEAVAAIRAALPDAVVLEGQTLVELAPVIAACRLFIGNDSGITHLAAALGVPTVALFGPTDPARWAPRGDRVAVLHAKGDWEAIRVEDVRRAAQGLAGVG